MPSTPVTTIPLLLEEQRHFFAEGKTREISMRLAALQRLEEALQEQQEPILQALANDLGKPEIEAFLAEYYFLLKEVRLVQRSLTKWLRPRRARNPFYFWPSRSCILREPYGVALIMAPWNYPIQLSLSPLIAAVAAGNTVILKPSELAPASEQLLVHIVSQCFPPEHVTVVTGDAETAQLLLEEPFDVVFFTGSTEIGRLVAQKASAHLTPHILELGGKCPCVVDRTADVALTARRVLAGKLFNAGQTCFAPDFLVVHEELKDAMVEALNDLLEELPWEQEMARVINPHHLQRLQRLITGKVIQKGADDISTSHLAPRLLPEVRWEDPIMREEIFGPLLPILSFSDCAALIERLRSFPSPLALYCFSRDQEFLQHLMDRIPSGNVCINDVAKQACNLHLPFGGVGESGHGRYRGKAGIEAFSQERAVTKRYFVRDWFETLPPREQSARFFKKWLR